MMNNEKKEEYISSIEIISVLLCCLFCTRLRRIYTGKGIQI